MSKEQIITSQVLSKIFKVNMEDIDLYVCCFGKETDIWFAHHLLGLYRIKQERYGDLAALYFYTSLSGNIKERFDNYIINNYTN